MSDLFAVAGWKFFIGGVKPTQLVDFVAADFAAQVWVEVDGWESMGGFGDAAQTIVTSLINRRRDVKQKGTRNAGSMENKFAALLGTSPDAGQDDMIDAEKTSSNYAFKIEADDSGGTSPTIFYFVGLVTSARYEGGGANTVQMLSATVEINSNVVKVAAV